MPRLGRGFTNAPATPFFEASLLPEVIKLQLCQDLLSEIGAERVRAPNSKKEIIHSCPIPNAHRNGDRNPSASLNYERLAFNCLGCGAQGGLLWFIAVTKGVEVDEAFRWLGDQTGVGGRSMDGKRVIEILEAIFAKQENRPEPMNVYPDSALTPWTFPAIHPYMTHAGRFGKIKCRGIPEENCQQFKIGYAEKYPMGWRRDENGELILDDDGEKIPLPPQERIIIPLFWDGKLLGWQARAIRGEDEPKYKNSVKFPRDRVLYGWEPGKDIVLVESPMSVLRHCHHQPMVASFGKQLTDPQLRILHKARSITMWFDPDAAGWKGTQRAIAELRRYVPLRVVDWKYRDTDPADLPDDVVDERVANAMPWSLWKWPGYESLMKWEG